MPLGTVVNLGPGDVVLDGVVDPVKGAQPSSFGSCLLWPNGWMDEDVKWYGSRPWPKLFVVSSLDLLFSHDGEPNHPTAPYLIFSISLLDKKEHFPA